MFQPIHLTSCGVAIICSVGVVALVACGGDGPSAPAGAAAHPVKAAEVAHAPWLTDMAEAQRQAADKKLPILADFTGSDWCHWCKLLDAEVFETREFVNWSATHAILLKVDFPHSTEQAPALKQQNQQLAEQYRIDGFPTILLLAADGTVLGKTGYSEGGPAVWIAQVEGLLKR